MRVTEKAKRPALPDAQCCFYCQSAIGGTHKNDCVLVKKTVKIHATYEITVPADWDEKMIEFHRNDGSWCVDNMFDELEELKGDECLCCHVQFKCFNATAPKFLEEE